MREIRTDDEKVLFREPGLQRLGQRLKDGKPLRADDDRDDGRNLPEYRLEEGQLDLQAMFPVMGISPEGKYPISPADELLTNGRVYGYLPQRCLCERIQRIDTGSDESHPMTWTEQEDPLVSATFRNPTECRCGHLPAEHISGMGNDDCLGGLSFRQLHPGAQHGVQFTGG